MFSKIAKISMSLALAAAVAPAAFAADHTGFVGIPLGVGFGNNSYGPRFVVGVDAGMKFAPEFGASVFFNFTKKDGAKFMPFGVEGNYFFDGDLAGMYAGVNLGAGKSDAETNFLFGAQVGYDYAVAEGFSIGAKVAYHMVMSDPKGHAFHTLANLRYWF